MGSTGLVTRILAALGALTLVAAAAAVIAVLAVVRRGLSAREQPSRMEELVARGVRRLSTPARVRGLTNPVRVTPEALHGAMTHWADHCATCHANNGSGDTTIGKNLYPKAPDMRLAQTQNLTDGELYAIIENGVPLTGMPAWGTGEVSNEESWALVQFIRQLPKLTPAELDQMQQMNPRSPHEMEEEQQENEFLQGSEPARGARHPSRR
jgi:cytochrome c5